jgi:L-gulonolactone oxidase
MVTEPQVRWSNWAGTFSCTPARVVGPKTEEEIVATVRAAAGARARVKVVGSGHSFTDIACTDGWILRLDGYNRVLAIDRERCLATVQGGITLHDLSEALAASGLAMENMGDVAYQSISGAISTGTHGTGERFRVLASQVVGLTLVTAGGQVLACSADENADVFDVARVGLGALGVISTVTIQCVPAYNIRSVQRPRKVDELLEEFDALSRGDHFEFFWWPHTEVAQAIANTRTQDAPQRSARRSGPVAYAKDILVENNLFGAIQQVARVRHSWIPHLAGITARTMTAKEMTDRSDRVFANERLVRFAEMEYMLPRPDLVPAFREVRSMIARRGFRISFPVEVRTVAADDIPLSPAFGRDSGCIAVHVFNRFEYEPYFREVEAIMKGHDGRPHWGKLHFQDAGSLQARYRLWADFAAVRDRLDPDRLFANAYLNRVLGS